MPWTIRASTAAVNRSGASLAGMPMMPVKVAGPYTRASAAAGESGCTTLASVRRSPPATADHTRSASAGLAFCCGPSTLGGTARRWLGFPLLPGVQRAVSPRQARGRGRLDGRGLPDGRRRFPAAGLAAAAGGGFGDRHASQPSFSLPATSAASAEHDGQRIGAYTPAGNSQSKLIGYRRDPRSTSAATRSAGTSSTCSRYGLITCRASYFSAISASRRACSSRVARSRSRNTAARSGVATARRRSMPAIVSA